MALKQPQWQLCNVSGVKTSLTLHNRKISQISVVKKTKQNQEHYFVERGQFGPDKNVDFSNLTVHTEL